MICSTCLMHPGVRAGGKYTWGSVLDGEADAGATDWNDPNYDEDTEQGVSYHLQLSVQIKMYKQAVRLRWRARRCWHLVGGAGGEGTIVQLRQACFGNGRQIRICIVSMSS